MYLIVELQEIKPLKPLNVSNLDSKCDFSQ